ncbi:MAG: thioredoxin [Alphaproteobacteria bacterium]|nr:thioredoxin [Alphaproteobacteria bacterium]
MDTLIGQSAGGAAQPKDATTQSFAADVIEASQQTPVIVDFWAPWCGPCKQLAPILEKTVRDAGGKVALVKINIDENPEIAQQLRIQSIPAVFAFDKGQPVDGFMGAQPESQIKRFVERLVGPMGPSPLEQALEQAKDALDAGDFASASNIYGQILRQVPGEAAAIAGLVRCLVGAGDLQEARELVDGLDDDALKNADVESAVSALTLAEQAGEADGDTAELQARLAQDAGDHQARFDLAMAYHGAGRNEQAIDELIEIIRRDREWNEQAARQQLLKLFEALGHTDPLTVAGRRKLSSILFS